MTAQTLNRPLSQAERALVERYHNLIYRVMNDCHVREDVASDLYGEAALALVLAAQRYLKNEELQRYRFTTIAYSRIRNVLLRQRRAMAKNPQILSLDAVNECGGTLYDVIADDTSIDPAKPCEAQTPPLWFYAAVRSRKKLYAAPRKEAA